MTLSTEGLNGSVVTDDQFSGSTKPTLPVALNAPAKMVTGGIDYHLPAGVSVGTTAQYVDDFSVRWGPHVGPVASYPRLDLRGGYSVPALPGLRVDIAAKHLLPPDHREFVGAPKTERRLLLRLTLDL